MSHDLNPEIPTGIAKILTADFDGSMKKLSIDKKIPYKTVYYILVRGTGEAAIILIGKMAKVLNCEKHEVANVLRKPSVESRRKGLTHLCEKAGMKITHFSTECFKDRGRAHEVIKSNKRIANFMKVVDAFGLDLESFEKHYMGSERSH